MNAKALQDAEDVLREAAALKRAANAGNAPLVNEKANALRDAIGKFRDQGVLFRFRDFFLKSLKNFILPRKNLTQKKSGSFFTLTLF
jgi:hypothetical protein